MTSWLKFLRLRFWMWACRKLAQRTGNPRANYMMDVGGPIVEKLMRGDFVSDGEIATMMDLMRRNKQPKESIERFRLGVLAERAKFHTNV